MCIRALDVSLKTSVALDPLSCSYRQLQLLDLDAEK